ncbi:MAG: hydrolase, partial [Cyclobacteriaceae bacterium]|nr:hydrolase [Cyclobacteriaceae bacterium]
MISTDKQNQAEYYSIDDFNRVEKIDAHVHVNSNHSALLEQATKDHMIIISINVDAYEDPIEKQQEYAVDQHDHFPDRFYYLTTFRVKGFEEPGWESKVLSYFEQSFANGAVGVKVWKNIGMEEKTRDGRFLMVDYPVFDHIFS